MPDPIRSPCGSWLSPLTSELIATATVNLVDVLKDGDDVYWIEDRPQEGGRCVLVRALPDGTSEDLTPAPYSVRSRVHEYGGGAAIVADGVAYFSNAHDQRLYRLVPGSAPEALTPEPPTRAGVRFADGLIDRARGLWLGVRESHGESGREPMNVLVSIDLQGEQRGTVLSEGHDFYSSPRLSPDGRQLAWLSWDHPDMPWVASELWVATFTGSAVRDAVKVAGGRGESIFQPEWAADGRLYFVSDRSGWWNLHRLEPDGRTVPVCPRAAEFGQPQWTFGMATYAWLSSTRAVCAFTERGVTRLAALDVDSGALTPFELPFHEYAFVRAGNETLAFKAGSATTPWAVVRFDPGTGNTRTLRRASRVADDQVLARCVSVPGLHAFPTSGGRTAYGLYYPPYNPDYDVPAGERPPLMVRVHGGPTSAASRTLDLRVQFWTSRGIAVMDVDYGGSTGYGREYRERLHLGWGVVDVDDCVAAVRFLVDQGRVDPDRVVISGTSAGGFTSLACLSFRGGFAGGASHYGVSDLVALARETHKFECRYLDWLVGPDPDTNEAYHRRSPARHADELRVPVAFFQGADDPIVPPSQTEALVEALRRNRVPVIYMLFAGERHGFRQSANIRHALDGELSFYATTIFKVGLRM